MNERWWLDLMPHFMRTWPWVRRYFWQVEEIEAVHQEADELQRWLNGKSQ